MDDLPLIVLRPLLGETPLSDILGRIAIKGGVRFGPDGKMPQTPAAPASETSLAVTGAKATVSALSFGRGNSLSAADRKAGKDSGSPVVRIRALSFNGLHFDTQDRSVSVKTLAVEAPKVRVTSPFALLGGIIGLVAPGDPALQIIAFPPGDTRINPAAQERLKRIAKALEDHPRVKIELISMYESASDTRGLKRLRVLRKVQTRQYAALPAKQRAANPVGATRLSSGEYERFLLHVYKTSPAGRKAKGNEEPDIIEQKLQALETVTQADLEALDSVVKL